MINAKMIARIMGALFFIEAGFLILCSFLAVYYNESDISAFLYSAAITAGAGSMEKCRKENQPPRWIRYCNPCLGVFFFIRYASILSKRIYSHYNGCFF